MSSILLTIRRFLGNNYIGVNVGMDYMTIGTSTDSSFNTHQTVFLHHKFIMSWKYQICKRVSMMETKYSIHLWVLKQGVTMPQPWSCIIFVCLHPANILTPPKTPLHYQEHTVKLYNAWLHITAHNFVTAKGNATSHSFSIYVPSSNTGDPAQDLHHHPPIGR